jgi:uncharacterized RDD family membrane protein YckC
MSDFPPPPPPGTPPPPPPDAFGTTPPGYTPYGQHQGAERAGFWIRFAAAFVDGLIYGIPLGLVTAILGLPTVAQQLLSIIVGGAYFVTQESGPTGQTIGKKLCGIRVVDQHTGGTIDQNKAITRYIVSLASGIACGLGYFWMLWDGDRQTWHDKASQTYVVKA